MSALRQLWSLRRSRPRFVAAAGLLLAALVTYPFVDWWLRAEGIAPAFRYWDFGAYGGAVERWRAGETLYESSNGSYHGTFLYPPVALFLFYPFVAGPFGEAAQAWVASSVALLWIGLQLVAGSLGLRLSLPERLLLLAALVGYQPLLIGAKLGQTAPFMAALLCFAFVLLRRGEAGEGPTGPSAGRGRAGRVAALASGACTAVVGVVKLAYAPVGAHLLADRRRFAGAVLAGVALLGVSLAVFGVETHRTYLDVLAWGVEQGGRARTPRPYLWLPPYFQPLAWLPGALAFRVAASLGIVALALLARGADERRSSGPDSASTRVDADGAVFALGVAAFPLLTPLAYTYYLVAVLPAAAVAVAVEFEVDGRPTLPVLAVLLLQFHAYGLLAIGTFVLDPVPPLAAVDALYFLVQPGLWGTALLSGLLAVRVVQLGDVSARLAALSRRATG